MTLIQANRICKKLGLDLLRPATPAEAAYGGFVIDQPARTTLWRPLQSYRSLDEALSTHLTICWDQYDPQKLTAREREQLQTMRGLDPALVRGDIYPAP